MNTLIFAALTCLSSARADESLDTLKKEVVTTYVSIAGHTFADAHAKAIDLQSAVAAFSKAPSATLQAEAQQAWNIARLPYLQAEIFLTAAEDGKTLDTPAVAGSEQAVGFRGLEWLLWGEDKSVDTAGSISPEECAKHATQLKANADLIVTQLAKHTAAWKAGSKDNAAATFIAQPTDEALAKIFNNVIALSDDLQKNRLGKPYETRDQKDESANFSDLTHAEFIYSGSGLANIIAGAYVGSDKQPKVQGNGLLQLAAKLGTKPSETMKLSINRVMLSVTTFRPPFDRALLAPDDSPAREAIKEMMDAFEELSAEISKTATALDLTLAADPAAAEGKE